MNIKSFIFVFSYAMLLISIMAIEPYEDEKKCTYINSSHVCIHFLVLYLTTIFGLFADGEIENSERNIERRDSRYKNNAACSDGIVVDNGGDNPLFPDCEKEGGMGHEGGGGKGGCAGGEGGDGKEGAKGKGSCGGGPPDITFPGSANAGGSGNVISIHNSRKMGNRGHKSYMDKMFMKN